MAQAKTRVLVVGGGFGGVKTALELGESDLFDVTLLSDRGDFHYYPTLYHTATGGKIAQSRIPLADLFAHTNVRLERGTAMRLHRRKKELVTKEGHTYSYDILVLALGTVTNYFGVTGLKTYSYSIKSPAEAKRFKNHLHQQLIDARQPDLNYVVVGGGPTGIELAGALPGYLKEIMEAHGVRRRSVHVDLIEAAPRLLPRMPKRLSRAVTRRLRSLGVSVHTGKKVQAATADELMVDGKPIRSHSVIWTAGVSNNPFFAENGFPTGSHGRVQVSPYLEAEEEIYVIGDNADTPYAGMAQTALYDAKTLADNLIRGAEGRLMQPYKPKKPITVIPVGPGWAAVLWRDTQLYGRLGWMLRSAADLVGFHDLQPWWRAAEQWATELGTEEECPMCAKR